MQGRAAVSLHPSSLTVHNGRSLQGAGDVTEHGQSMDVRTCMNLPGTQQVCKQAETICVGAVASSAWHLHGAGDTETDSNHEHDHEHAILQARHQGITLGHVRSARHDHRTHVSLKESIIS
jgi:hypothetical protein